MQNLTLRGIAMSTVAYITALTIGIFAVSTISASAEPRKLSSYQPAVDAADPLVKYKGAKTISRKGLVELLYAVGFRGRGLQIAWAVAMKESGGRPTAVNENIRTGDSSYGIFQINMIGDLGPMRLAKFGLDTKKDLLDPVNNVKAVFHMTNGGKDWSAWGLGQGAYDGSPAEPEVTKWIPYFPG